jgi:hypothetical protein
MFGSTLCSCILVLNVLQAAWQVGYVGVFGEAEPGKLGTLCIILQVQKRFVNVMFFIHCR